MNGRQKEVIQSELDSEKKTIRELKSVYERARQDCLDKIKALEARTDVENMQSIVYQKQYQQALKKQLDSILDMMNTEQFETISDYLGKCYEDGFLGTMYDLHGQGIPLILPIDQDQATKAIQIDSKISEGLYNRLGIDTKTLKDSIRANVSRGIAASQSWSDVARNIDRRMRIGANRAIRIARTEGHRIQCEAAFDAQKKAKEKGADVVKQWDATLDKRTRPSHASLDGKIVEVDEAFRSPETGAEALFPGEFGVASEDINCRCQILQRAKWALDEDELQTLKDRAEYFGLDKSDDFEDFKKKYLSETKDILPTVPKFTEAKSIVEAEAFVKQYVDDSGFGALGVSYKGVSVDVANEINRTFANFFETFDVEKFGGIVVPAGNTKLGQKISGATAAYSPIRNSFLLNRKSMKDMKTAIKSFQAEKDALQSVLEHPERYDFSKLSRTLRETINRSKISGRATVPESIEEALQHELGHMIEKKVYQSTLWNDVVVDMPKYADRISGYAGSDKSEYIAESFVSYLKNEGLIDPNLNRIFESLKR